MNRPGLRSVRPRSERWWPWPRSSPGRPRRARRRRARRRPRRRPRRSPRRRRAGRRRARSRPRCRAARGSRSAPVALGVGVGAEQAEQVRAERAAGGPGLLPGEAPAAVASSRTARLLMPARSLPALGSHQPWHHRSSAAAMRGRKRSFCSWVPNSKIVGASRKMPFWVTRCGAPGPVVLLLEDEPLPQAGAAAAVLLGPRHHRPAVGEEPLLPLEVAGEALGGVARRAAASAGTLASSQARHSARKASSASVQVRSTRFSPSAPVAPGPNSDAPSETTQTARPTHRNLTVDPDLTFG